MASRGGGGVWKWQGRLGGWGVWGRGRLGAGASGGGMEGVLEELRVHVGDFEGG